MKAKLRVGVVGYGAIGRHHARNLALRDDITFVGIADPSTATCLERPLNPDLSVVKQKNLLRKALCSLLETGLKETVA